jgi:hypothetical protein
MEEDEWKLSILEWNWRSPGGLIQSQCVSIAIRKISFLSDCLFSVTSCDCRTVILACPDQPSTLHREITFEYISHL